MSLLPRMFPSSVFIGYLHRRSFLIDKNGAVINSILLPSVVGKSEKHMTLNGVISFIQPNENFFQYSLPIVMSFAMNHFWRCPQSDRQNSLTLRFLFSIVKEWFRSKWRAISVGFLQLTNFMQITASRKFCAILSNKILDLTKTDYFIE